MPSGQTLDGRLCFLCAKHYILCHSGLTTTMVRPGSLCALGRPLYAATQLALAPECIISRLRFSVSRMRARRSSGSPGDVS